MKTRYKVMIWAGALLAAYVAAAVAAWRIMPAKIAEAERKRVGVTMALAKIANDQLAVSRRVSEITKKTLGSGRDKAAQVVMLLGDGELNRIARTYTGADWATTYSSFSGSVRHMRDVPAMRQSDREKNVSELDKKIDDLEGRKRALTHRLLGTKADERQRRIEMEDIDRQLRSLRSSNAYRESAAKGKASGRAADAKAKNEEAIFKLACECESQTVGQLLQDMANQAAALHQEEAEPDRLRQRMTYFDIWPFNKLAAMPVE